MTITPSTTCYEVRCAIDSNPKNVLAGSINIESTEQISVNGTPYVSSYKALRPKPFSTYNATTLQPALTDVKYVISPDDVGILVNFVRKTLGPFYLDKDTCESSDETKPSFHFFKQEPMNYYHAADDAKL